MERSRPGKHDLGGYSGLDLRIRGDGGRYKINLKTDLRADAIRYRAVFETREDEITPGSGVSRAVADARHSELVWKPS